MTLFILCKPPSPDTLRLMEAEPQARLLLLGKALLSDPRVFEGRQVFVVQEEARELGLEARLAAPVQSKPAAELMPLICESRILNLG